MNTSESITTQTLRLVDAQGRERLVLSAEAGVPVIRLLREDGSEGASLVLDDQGRGAVTLHNPDRGCPDVRLQIDDKGAHVKFDRDGGGSAYLFLNNAGGSGMVLVDAQGHRRINATVAADGSSRIERLDQHGAALP